MSLRAFLDRRLLAAAGVTVLAYAGSSCLFPCIPPLLIGVTGVAPAPVGAMMLACGGAVAIGNVVGGRVTVSRSGRAEAWGRSPVGVRQGA